MSPETIERLELELLLDAVLKRYGYDFRDYAPDSLGRRVQQILSRTCLEHPSELIPRLVHDEQEFARILAGLTVTVTEMFRDPEVFAALHAKVVPLLKTYPFAKVWIAGCATGEEVYSLAVLLAEEGLDERVHLYATDINQASLDAARNGIYKQKAIEAAEGRYRLAGGKGALADHFVVRYGHAKVAERIRRSVTFAYHNLVTDGVFGEMNLILCRNVLIYFNPVLQDRVLSLFRRSLCRRGFLSLGPKETLQFSSVAPDFEPVDLRAKVYRAREEAYELAEEQQE